MQDDSSQPSYTITPVETPQTSRVATRESTQESQSSVSQPTKAQSPKQGTTAPSTAPTSQPSAQGSAEERPHQVKFIFSDSPEDPPPSTPAILTPKLPPDPNAPYRRSKRRPPTTHPAEIPD